MTSRAHVADHRFLRTRSNPDALFQVWCVHATEHALSGKVARQGFAQMSSRRIDQVRGREKAAARVEHGCAAVFLQHVCSKGVGQIQEVVIDVIDAGDFPLGGDISERKTADITVPGEHEYRGLEFIKNASCEVLDPCVPAGLFGNARFGQNSGIHLAILVELLESKMKADEVGCVQMLGEQKNSNVRAPLRVEPDVVTDAHCVARS